MKAILTLKLSIMITEIKAYKPECCNKCFITKGGANRHEKLCLKNPKTRNCKTCANLLIQEKTFYNPNHGGDPGSTDYEFQTFYCVAKDEPFEDIWETHKIRNCELHTIGDNQRG